ncbi:MAG TPA: hypothetical protein VGH29_04795 [Candidatus Binataceae bacterium]
MAMMETIERLRRLRPGEKFRFYRGTPFENLSQRPFEYYELMMRLRDEVNELAIDGRISVERHKGPAPYYDITYVATGILKPS